MDHPTHRAAPHRLLIAGQTSRMLCDILFRVAASQDDFQVVAEPIERVRVVSAVHEHDANVVLLSIGEDELPSTCRDLLNAKPEIIIIGVVQDGRRATVFLNNLGPEQLLETVRQLRRAP